jgi:hypothetical protein
VKEGEKKKVAEETNIIMLRFRCCEIGRLGSIFYMKGKRMRYLVHDLAPRASIFSIQ